MKITAFRVNAVVQRQVCAGFLRVFFNDVFENIQIGRGWRLNNAHFKIPKIEMSIEHSISKFHKMKWLIRVPLMDLDFGLNSSSMLKIHSLVLPSLSDGVAVLGRIV
jgi:hypothetical protein